MAVSVVLGIQACPKPVTVIKSASVKQTSVTRECECVSKVILFLLVFFVLYVLFRAKKGRRPSAPDTHGRTDTPEAIVACAYCGVHVPSSEAINVGGRSYCSKEHSQLG